jgi:adenosylcobinamide-phosphate synthase
MLSLPLTVTLATAGVAVDRWLGEPRTAHPLVGFGTWAMRLEKRYNTGRRLRLKGLLAWALAVMPPVLIAWWLVAVLPFFAACAVHVVLLWFAIGAM